MRILFAGIASSPFESQYKLHYSVFKTFGAAQGFAQMGHEAFLLSKNEVGIMDLVKLKPASEIDREFLDSLDYIIFGQERGVEVVLDNVPIIDSIIKEKFEGKRSTPKVIVKTGKHTWISKSKRWTYQNVHKAIDYLVCQEPSFAETARREIPNLNIQFSQMGVFENMPEKKAKSPFKKHKYNLVYMGRMRQNPSRMPFMIDIMENLGSDFHLNILPGSFSKPKHLLDKKNKSGVNKFGVQEKENYDWLVNYFSVCKNITVHKPVEWGDHWQYLYHSHLGLDFSPHWSNEKYPAGNAKLLEYMAAGLPSITESSVGNSELVIEANGGIIIPEAGNLNLYCTSIKKALSMKWDRDKISDITIKNNSWKKRAEEMLIFMEK